ncbi:MAG: putative peptidoglycan binding domain protein [Micavibrio sp.]|nr:putative peptidoglycan binding domain protein [Micavibrio sp.]
MQGSNRKNPGTPGSPNPYIQTPATGPLNQNAGQAAAPGGLATARILGLLNQIGDKLVSSEQERIAMREALSDLENRSDMAERMFLTIEDKVSKNDSVEMKLIERQEKLEQLVSESAERLERAEALTEKIEEAIALQNRLARRLEKTSQDKARILTKIERIEEGVEKTREALNSKALIQLAEQVAAGGWLPQAPAANDRLNAEIAAATPWWKRPYKMQTGMAASLLAAGIIGGLAISQMAAHWPDATGGSSTLVVSSTPATGEGDSVLPGRVATGETPVPQSTEARDVAPYSDKALDGATDMDAIAADMNAITPGVAPEQAEPVKVASAAPTATTQATAAPAPAAPATAARTVIPAVTPAVQDNFDVDGFIRAQGDRSAPLATRIKADPALPAVVRSVEDKAFQGVPEAQHDLAAIYTAGHAGVTVDFKRAATWFGEAAANGVANARYNLGVLYHQGLGVDKDVSKAIGWYRAAARLNHPEAEYNLGIAYIEGIGTKYDPRMAAKYFEQAARGGVLEAAYNLGLIYENGLLGDADANEAVYWYNLASDASPEARLALNQITRRLNLGESDVARIVKEYNAVYKIPVKGSTASSAPASVKTGAVAAPLTPADAISPDDPALIAKQIPALTKEESKNLLTSLGKDRAVIEQVQEQLIRMKLFAGQPDGVGGPDTEAAIRAYQKTNGLTVTGKPSEELLVRMLASDIDSASGNRNLQGL